MNKTTRSQLDASLAHTGRLKLSGNWAARLRMAALLLGGVAGFLGVGEAGFNRIIDSFLGPGTANDGRTFIFAAIGLVGAVFAKRHPIFCAGLELAAGIGLLANHHTTLGPPMLAGALLSLISLRAPAPAETAIGTGARADLASGLSAIGLVGLALVGGPLLLLAVILLAAGSLGGSTSGSGAFYMTLVLILAGCAIALLIRRARR
jgi:hypothetical protein